MQFLFATVGFFAIVAAILFAIAQTPLGRKLKNFHEQNKALKEQKRKLQEEESDKERDEVVAKVNAAKRDSEENSQEVTLNDFLEYIKLDIEKRGQIYHLGKSYVETVVRKGGLNNLEPTSFPFCPIDDYKSHGFLNIIYTYYSNTDKILYFSEENESIIRDASVNAIPKTPEARKLRNEILTIIGVKS